MLNGVSIDARNVSPIFAVDESTESIMEIVIEVPAGIVTSLVSITGIGGGGGAGGVAATGGGGGATGA